MAKKDKELTPAAAMKAIQVDAFLAYIEWPLLLFHRLRELERHLAVTAGSNPTEKSTGAPVGLPPQVVTPAEATPAVPEKKPSAGSRLRKTSLPAPQSLDASEPPALAQPIRKVAPVDKAPAGSASAIIPRDSRVIEGSSAAQPAPQPDSNTEAAVLEFLNGFSMEGNEP